MCARVYTSVYIYIYIYVCVCVCVCVSQKKKEGIWHLFGVGGKRVCACVFVCGRARVWTCLRAFVFVRACLYMNGANAFWSELSLNFSSSGNSHVCNICVHRQDKFLNFSPAVLAVWRWPVWLFWAVCIAWTGVFLALVYRPSVPYCRR